MKDKEDEIRIVEHAVPEGVARWCDRIEAIIIPGRPELGLFPSMLTWHCGNNRVERPYVRSVTYFPELLSLRDCADADEIQMKYQSVHDPASWIFINAARDGSRWQAEKFLHGENVGTTIGRPGDHFCILLSQLPINDDEKHFVRDWPAEEIATMYEALRPGSAAHDPKEESWDIPMFCRKILDSVQKVEGLGRKEAASLLCELLKKEAAASVIRP